MYKATRKIHTEFSSFEKGDVVTDMVGERYAGFEEITEETVEVKVVEEVKVEAPKKAKKAPKKEEPKEEEILVEDSSDTEVEITEE